MVIDAHVRFWKYDNQVNWINKDMRVLHQDYLPEHLELNEKRNHIDGLVAIQARQTELETRFMIEIAKTHPEIKGFIGWIDLTDEGVKQKLEHFSQFPIIKGWCYSSGEDESGDVLLNENFLRGISYLEKYKYTYDLQINNHQWSAAAALVEKFPWQKFMVDHCGRPDIKHKSIDDWKTWIRELAKYPNVYCKLSGLLTEATWKLWHAGEFYPYLDVVFEAFGTRRLIFGSDWPSILLSGKYVQWKSLLHKYMMDKFTVEERENVFGVNAVRFYGL
jgi:L-fuconolactonase